MKLILAIESTCDETAAAVIADDLRVLGSSVASQDQLHQRFSGVVPEIAARAHVERILPVIDEALRRAGCGLGDLAAVAVATTPGLANSLLVGLSAAKAIAIALRIPLLGINHLHAHVYACRLAAGRDVFPCVGLIISGGHTHLFHYRDPLDARLLGGTIDDAAGEAFDKVATLLGLGYPGGPALSWLAESGDPKALAFPRSFIHEPRLDFSFSGLKTAVRYAISPQGRPVRLASELSLSERADIAASFELAVAETIAIKATQAIEQTGVSRLCVGGGVAANRVVRAELELRAKEKGFELLLAPRELCTDNAVMGAIAWEKYWRGQFDELEIDILPGLLR